VICVICDLLLPEYKKFSCQTLYYILHTGVKIWHEYHINATSGASCNRFLKSLLSPLTSVKLRIDTK